MDELFNTITDNSILIIPNNLKEDFLLYIRNYKKDIINIKIFELKEFINNLTFTYDEKAIDFVMKKYNTNYSISKMFLDNIKYIDNDSNNSKIHTLYDIKTIVKDYLIKNKLFKKLINNKNIYVYGYDYIDKYSMSILNNVNNLVVLNKKNNNYNHKIYKYNTLEDEVIGVVEKISELISNGISINNIFISNLDDDYRTIFNRIFNMYNIPFNLNNKISLYETIIGKDFINILDLESIKNKYNLGDNDEIYKNLISVLNKFYFTSDYNSVKDNIIEVMKKTYLSIKKYDNAINEIDIINNIISNDKYIFLVGFNLNIIPSIVKDEDYINDKIKPDNMEKSFEMNIINKDIYYKAISNIKNLYISYKEKYLNEEYYPSILIDEYNMKVVDNTFKYSNYSNSINKLLLSKSIDNLTKYNEKNDIISILFNNYNNTYNTYDNRFSGINKDNMYSYLNNRLNLSYSSMDNYYKCAFRYYLTNILKLDKYEDTIQTYIGNLFHYVLSNAFLDNFDFDKTVNNYLSNNEYENSYKNNYFINKVLDDLRSVIDTIRYQNTLGSMNEAYYEKEINVRRKSILDVSFKGFIDKILKHDNYIAIIDYKTYMLDIKLNYLPYGLSMQLPVYLYLSKNFDKDSKVIGIYLQQVLFNKFNKDNNKSLSDLIKDNMKLKGYTIGDESIIPILDTTYENSELIYGMKLTKNGFSSYSKLLTEKEIDNIYKITDKKINECIKSIENAIFTINPKSIDEENIGCKYCKYKDICYMTNKDVIELDNISDLSFLDK